MVRHLSTLTRQRHETHPGFLPLLPPTFNQAPSCADPPGKYPPKPLRFQRFRLGAALSVPRGRSACGCSVSFPLADLQASHRHRPSPSASSVFHLQIANPIVSGARDPESKTRGVLTIQSVYLFIFSHLRKTRCSAGRRSSGILWGGTR